MAVPEHKRGEQKFEILEDMLRLAKYTEAVIYNDKHIPKKYRYGIVQDIHHETIQALLCVKKANTTPLTQAYAIVRNSFQMEAIEHLEGLMILIELANSLGSFNSLAYWTGLTLKSINSIKNWQKSDKQKLK